MKTIALISCLILIIFQLFKMLKPKVYWNQIIGISSYIIRVIEIYYGLFLVSLLFTDLWWYSLILAIIIHLSAIVLSPDISNRKLLSNYNKKTIIIESMLSIIIIFAIILKIIII